MGRTCSLSVICAVVCGLGVAVAPARAAPGWSLAAWVCADGDLGAAGTRYAATLERTAAAQGWTLALEIDRGALGSVRITVDATGEPLRRRQEPANMGSGDALAQFLRWAAEQPTGPPRVLVIYGHGPGADAAGALAGDALVIDDSERDWLTGAEVAEALGAAALKPDLIVLDCCYGMRVETLWALRHSTGLVLAWSGHAPSGGLPWAALGLQRARAEEPAGALLTGARQLGEASGRLSAVRPGGLDMVAEAVAGLERALDAQGALGDAAVAGARAWCADRGPNRELCDLRELCARLAVVGEGAVAVTAGRVVAAIALWRSGGPGSAPEAQDELLVWMPGGVLTGAASEVSGEFAAVSGWGNVVARHWRRQQELLRPTVGTPQRGRDAT